MGIDPNQVRNDIKFLIKKNTLGNAIIDVYEDKVVFQNKKRSKKRYNTSTKKVKVICPGCNQEVYIPEGERRTCEYCGNILIAPK